jgi:predicted unusual protein kinase regulating ubiquinone biosynthesis (AarF/ABC1/UbiB family)
VTRDGDEVVVKVQYPGVAEAVETDLRNAAMLLPLVRRLAPGIDVKSLFAELRERIAEELDYELEAQHQRRIERRFRGHPFIAVPRVHTDLSTRRVLVSDYVEGARFEEVRALDEARRDRYGEIVFRFFFGLLYHDRIALGDPHPGNYLLCPDDRVAFVDYGMLRDVEPERVAAEAAIAHAVRSRDGAGLIEALRAGGYLPADRAEGVDAELALKLMRSATRWYAVPGERRFSAERRRHRPEPAGDPGREPREPNRGAEVRAQINRFTLPPDTMLIRRMHALVAVVLRQLRAGADWGAIAAEYLHGEPPATALGDADAAFRAGRRG